MVTAKSQFGQRARSALVLGAVVALIAGVAVVGSASTAQAAGLCSSSPYKSGTQTISINQCSSGLSDQQDVTITGSGFTDNGNVTFYMCKNDPTSSDDCDGADGGSTTADGTGAINDTFTVLASFDTDGGSHVDCNNGSPSPNCSVLVANGDTADDVGAFMDVPFGTPASTTTTTGGTTTTTGGGSSTSTTSGSTTSTTSAAGTCPTGGPTKSPSVTVSPLQATPGSTVTVSGEGFPAGKTVNINLCSTPVLLITAVINSSGSLPATAVTIPATAAAGAHDIVVQVANNPAQAGVASITVVASNVTPSPVATPTEATPTFTG